MDKIVVNIDGRDYEVLLKKQVSESIDAPRLLIVSYLPDKKAIGLLKCCVETIKKFTDTPYEIWVIDNNSPLENLNWLKKADGINLVLNRTVSKEKGSYDNAVGLEIGRRLVDQDSKFIMTLHQDTVVCRTGWLEYMLSKFSAKVRAVGVREDKVRVKEGILHVLGYLIDYQLFKELKLDFLPQLPDYDVGDKAIMELKKVGYQIYATPNTLWDKEAIKKIPVGSRFKDFNADRSIDDEGNVIFMHLGRGVRKSTGEGKDVEKSIEAWERFIENNLFPERKEVLALEKKLYSDIGFSCRRFFVDKFFLKNIHQFLPGTEILDIGGKKEHKRGTFDIGKYPLRVKYANIDASTKPDYLCDAANIPVRDNTFNGVILAEVLEHVKEPKKLLTESFRVLKPGGKILITVPFMFHIHADPQDYARYTEQWYQECLAEIGFRHIRIETQGGFGAVVLNLLKFWLCQRLNNSKFKNSISAKIRTFAVYLLIPRVLNWDNINNSKKNTYSKFVLGYGIIGTR